MPVYGDIQIITDPAIFDGRPIINSHRITVHDVVVHTRSGMPIDEVARGYGLTPEEVAAALAYYGEHKATIDLQIATDQREFARRATADTSPAAERMREIGKTLKRPQTL